VNVGNVIPDKSECPVISPAIMHSRSILVSLIYRSYTRVLVSFLSTRNTE